MSYTPPPRAPTPPGIEQAVNEHLDLVHEMREIRQALTALTAIPEMRREMTLMRGAIGHLADSRTVDRLLIGRIERVMTLLAKHLGVKVPHENGHEEERRG
jgi:hypothetical protein